MKTRLFLSLVLGILFLALSSLPVSADGIIIPDPCPVDGGCKPFEPTAPPCDPRYPCPVAIEIRPLNQLNIKYHHVTVKIDNQIATTHVDQVFYNPNTWGVEGTYVFPLPEGATISKFILWVDGKPVEGKVMDAVEARKVYESYIRRNNDPALLEYIGRGAFQARIFPIPAKGERRIELEYQQTLTADNSLVHYTYPLNTEKFSKTNLESVAVTVEIASSASIRAVYSPSHAVAVTRTDNRHASASYEAKNVKPDSDFSLYYSLGETEAFHLFSYRDPTDPQDSDGFFMLLLAPKPGDDQPRVAKDVILVLDHSGSMDGEKFRQAQMALTYVLNHLNEEDRFSVVAFSTGVEHYARELRPADEAAEAVSWVNGLSARGSTDINRALLESAALAEKVRPTYLLFLTDGLPTVGITKSQTILANVEDVMPENVRIFPFGVGYDVDTFLLDTLSQQHHGLSTYVQPGQPLDEILSSFYEKISTPVLTNLELNFGKLAVYDIYPYPLPDLFAGNQVVVVGRYRQGATVDVTLTGAVNGTRQTFTYPQQGFSQDSRSAATTVTSLPRLWATRKIGYLLNKIRLHGSDKEAIDQIVRLSIRYGIVTSYTSYLVTEPAPLGADNQSRLAQEAFRQAQAQPTQAASGQGAVQKAADQGQLQQAQQAPGLPSNSAQSVRTIGTRTFVLNNQVWMDTAYDPKQMTAIKVAFLSEDYFRLAQSRTDVSQALAQAERVIVVVDGKAYEVVDSALSTQPVDIPQTITPQPGAITPTAGVTSSTPASSQLKEVPVQETSPVVWMGLGVVILAAMLVTLRKVGGK